MAKIDEIKEHIGALKSYLNIVVAVILAIGAGVAKLYLENNIGLIFWLGIVIILIAIVTFIMISKAMHKNIKKLKDLK